VYTFRQDEKVAFEVSLLYFIMAKRKKSKQKIDKICDKAIFWLKKANVELPEYLQKLSPEGQLDTIELILVNNKAKIGARLCWQEICEHFGLTV
ncbi:hypothetical protein KKI23_03360, partial [Patescibacteria group bacterium]|nr:hypothetical protein [Patescibacteria group bacterium]